MMAPWGCDRSAVKDCGDCKVSGSGTCAEKDTGTRRRRTWGTGSADTRVVFKNSLGFQQCSAMYASKSALERMYAETPSSVTNPAEAIAGTVLRHHCKRGRNSDTPSRNSSIPS